MTSFRHTGLPRWAPNTYFHQTQIPCHLRETKGLFCDLPAQSTSTLPGEKCVNPQPFAAAEEDRVDPLEELEDQRFDRRHYGRGVIFPDSFVGIDIHLDFIAIRVTKVEALAHGVVAHPVDDDT